jgi:hypothetical protein
MNDNQILLKILKFKFRKIFFFNKKEIYKIINSNTLVENYEMF